MAYEAKAIANYFLEKAKAEGRTLTPMEIQKLVYFAHGWYLALFGQPLIKEPIQAWSYGPVIPSLYQEFKRFGDQAIEELATEERLAGMKLSLTRPSIEKIENPQERENLKRFLDRIWQVYSRFSAAQLSNLTHENNSPWRVALDQSQGARATVIRNDLIQRYFEDQKHDARQAEH
jgi:uncharacterized phage-associated protein